MKINVKCDVCNGVSGLPARWYSGKTKHNICADCAAEEIRYGIAKHTGKCAYCYRALVPQQYVCVHDAKIYCSQDCMLKDISYVHSLEDNT